MKNKLSNENSPYLLQHSSNPVNWLPWGEEAFRLAKEKDLPVFLSIGYSTCHWCHVMEKESFEDEEVALILNKNFISIIQLYYLIKFGIYSFKFRSFCKQYTVSIICPINSVCSI